MRTPGTLKDLKLDLMPTMSRNCSRNALSMRVRSSSAKSKQLLSPTRRILAQTDSRPFYFEYIYPLPRLRELVVAGAVLKEI